MSDQPPYEPPPPPGGYPPPPGGYPPPSDPYGTPPPPPPGPGAGGYSPPGQYGGYGTEPFDLGRAFSYAWNKFQKNAGPLILVMIVAFVGIIVASIFSAIVRASFGSGLFSTLFAFGVTQVLLFVVSSVLQIGVYRSSLAVTAGEPIDIGRVFSSDQLGPFIIGSLLYGLMVGVGTIFCILPGIALAFLGFFWPYYVLDQNQAPVDAIKSSFSLVNSNLGQMIPFAIVAFIVYAIGAVLCGVGLLVSAPVVLIAVAYAYRTLNGQSVAP